MHSFRLFEFTVTFEQSVFFAIDNNKDIYNFITIKKQRLKVCKIFHFIYDPLLLAWYLKYIISLCIKYKSLIHRINQKSQ